MFQTGDARLEFGIGGYLQNHQTGRRHAAEITGLAGTEQRHQLFQAWIMPDQLQARAFAVLIGDLHQRAGCGVVNAGFLALLDETGDLQHLLKGFARAPCARAQDAVGQQLMGFQPVAGSLGFCQALARERSVDIVLADSGRFGMGMPQQYQFPHQLTFFSHLNIGAQSA